MSTLVDDKKSTFGKSFSKASQMIGVGTPLHKQLKFAILEGNEEKAISIYNSKEMGKQLKSTLHPSKPFPSKKDPNGETPLHLSAKQALPILFSLFLEFGGRPDILNSRKESCAHTVCSEPTSDAKRAEIVDHVLRWRSVNPSTNRAVSVDLNGTDIDGNSALHLAACHGLLQCIEKLIAHRARVFMLNNSNLTCAELADISGRASVGTAIELASLFAAPTESGRLSWNTTKYYNILNMCNNNGMGVLVLDSHSLTASSLLKFISRTVAMVSEVLQETPARTEVMLMHYNWNVRRLIEDYRRDARAVTAAVRIQPRDAKNNRNEQALVVHSEGESAVVLHESELHAPFGVPISEVYLDPSHRDVGPFSVVRGGKKVSYSIRQVHGKTVVVPFDVDPAVRAHTLDDQHVSANSHLKPEATSVCSMCGEQMLEACSVQHYMADTLVQPKHRELQCGSGHKFCFSCWSGFLRAHASGQDGLHGLQCPGVNCGETLDLQWAPVLLNSPDLVNRVMTQRLQLVAQKMGLQWCTVPNCGLIVHVHAAEGVEARGSDCKAGNIPLCGLCANGHGVCVCCGNEPHAPCQCEDLVQWHELVREVSHANQTRDQSSAGHMLLHAPTHKDCRKCGAPNGKEVGSNHIRCSTCFRDFCWVCLQDWDLHLADSSAQTHGHAPFQCNNLMELHAPLPPGLSERHAVFLQYFARYQAHMESFALEAASFRTAQDRVLHGLKAAHNGDLLWLLGDTVSNPYNPAESANPSSNEQDVTLATAYLHREKCLDFLLEAFEELLRCRTLLRWTYPFIMFRFEREFQQSYAHNGMMLQSDRSDQQIELMGEVNALEVYAERLSDLVAHKRLRGSRNDIIEATLSVKGQRIKMETYIVQHNSGFGAASLEYTRSASMDRSSVAVAEARVGGAMKGMVAAVEVEGPIMSSTAVVPKAQSMQAPHSARGTETQSSSYAQSAIPVEGRSASSARPMPPPPPPPVYAADSDSEYGYNSGDDEGLQVCTDVAAIKIGDSPRLAAGSKTLTTTQKLSLDAQRTAQQTEETTTTIKTTRVMAVTSGNNTHHSNNNINAHSGNSLMSDLTTGDANHCASPLPTPTYARIPRMPLSGPTSPLSPAQQSVAASTGNNSRLAVASKASSISSKQLTKEVSRLWQKQSVERIDEQEVKIVYSLMSKHKITRDKAVRMFLEEHDERLYNPKAVYLFPGEEYHPEEEDDDSEEERRKQEMFGRVEYNHKAKTDSDTASVSEVSPTTIEQRLIGAKKDPDQEALEHALLLSAQEQEFGINMYDSLTPEDELVLAEYMSQGFTREEGALIIYEEKFGKTTNSQFSSVIPAMPTLQAVQHYGGSHSLSHQSEYYSDEEDDEEIADLIGRGYTREQAIAVIQAHKEKARKAAASQHPTDPTHYYPHPDEERFNLTEKEEREVELVMSRQGCSRRIAVECVVEMRTTAPSSARREESFTSSEYYSESAEVRSYMDRGYSREQALQLIRNKASAAVSSTSSVGSGSNARRPSFSSQMSFDYDSSIGGEDSEVIKYMNRGYTREQAWELVRRAQPGEAPARRASGVADNASVYSGTSTIHTRASGYGTLPANMDVETAELVRQQNEDYGTNMFTDITPDDDEEVERLMADGYTYNEALLEIFNYSHPPRPVGRPYTSYPPPQPAVAQSFYQSGALPPQYPVAPASQSFYMQQPGYMPAQSYYPPQPQPVIRTQSFYQQQQPGAMPAYAQQPGAPYGQQVTLLSPEEESYSTNSTISRKAPSNRNGKPPVLNGSQTLLEQKRQDAAKAARERERESEGTEKKPLTRKTSSLMNVFGGATRRKADNEDDLMMRATHMSDVDRGRKEATDKQRVPKLKYNENNVQKIMKMGFTRDQAVQALVESRDDVDEAARMLVDTC